jgi:predicted Rossmann-fold nucleotide-binding protein
MKAGHEGPKREKSFGLSIRLPFETSANEVIENDPKLINFRYFFTRKLMFLSHADAIAVFPGGYGTQDEVMESLVLMQTGRGGIVPVVLLEGQGGVYWRHWDTYIRKNLLDNAWISPEDLSLYFIAETPEDAAEHIRRFYANYHSNRYVREKLVFRLKRPLADAQLEQLNDEFAILLDDGAIERTGPLEGEDDHLDLPRIMFTHTRAHLGVLRQLIDRINDFASEAVSR